MGLRSGSWSRWVEPGGLPWGSGRGRGQGGWSREIGYEVVQPELLYSWNGNLTRNGNGTDTGMGI